MSDLVPTERFESMILLIRGQRVMLDADLARAYGVATKRLNEQVKRNSGRFPPDFMFQLTEVEKTELVANCDQFRNLKHSKSLPFAFSEHGAIMLASVLNSEIAVRASIQVVRAFVRLREMLSTHHDLARKLAVLERRLGSHDEAIRTLFSHIRQLMEPPPAKSKPMGFRPGGYSMPSGS